MSFLSRQELKELTGRAFRDHQIAWLRENSYVFEINAAGNILVAKGYVDKRFGVVESFKKPEEWSPNFEALTQ